MKNWKLGIQDWGSGIDESINMKDLGMMDDDLKTNGAHSSLAVAYLDFPCELRGRSPRSQRLKAFSLL